jgi:hypothetical protein
MNSEINHCYQVLELEPSASLEQVKQAWRELAKVWHPDRFPNDAKMQQRAQERLKMINRAYELLSQFLKSDSAEKTTSMAVRGWEDEPSENEKTGLNKPPMSPVGNSGMKQSANPKNGKTKVICLLLLVLGVAAYSVKAVLRYHAFTYELSVVRGIHIGDSRDEVKYRLGFPPYVNGSVEQGEFGLWKPVYTVLGHDNDVNRMPSKTKVDDYYEWVYEEPYSNVRLTVEFNSFGFVESLQLYSDNEKGNGWRRIVGLNCGDSEDQVIRIGHPSRQTLDGVSKKIEFRDIGVEVTLSKGRAYMILIKGPPPDKAAVFRRLMRILP